MSQSSSSVNDQRFVAHNGITCHCGLPVREYTSRQPPSYGLRFICCPKKRAEQCPFFEWVDNGACMACAGTISSLQARIRENQSTIGAMEERIVDLIVSERLLQLRVQEQEESILEMHVKVAEEVARAESAELLLMGVRKRLKLTAYVGPLVFFVMLALVFGLLQNESTTSNLSLGP